MMELKAIVVVLMACMYQVQSVCVNAGSAWLPDPLNCNQFYMCLKGQKVPYTCPVGSVADVYSKSCVPKGSPSDHCSIPMTTPLQVIKTTASTTPQTKETSPAKTMKTTVSPVIKTTILPVIKTTLPPVMETTPSTEMKTNPLTTITNPPKISQKIDIITTLKQSITTSMPARISLKTETATTLQQKVTMKPSLTGLKICRTLGTFPVASNCARYFECTSTLTASLKECPYPQLFNTVNNRCELPALVSCGSRYEPLDPCEYSENRCSKSHCLPCYIRFPSCRGLPDGLNPWTGREGSPFFAICAFQRVVYQGKCSYEQHAEEQIFDPTLRVCVKASFHSK